MAYLCQGLRFKQGDNSSNNNNDNDNKSDDDEKSKLWNTEIASIKLQEIVKQVQYIHKRVYTHLNVRAHGQNTLSHTDVLSDNLIMQFYTSTINISVTLSISIRCMVYECMSIKYLCNKMVVLRKCKIWINYSPPPSEKFINKIWPGPFSTYYSTIIRLNVYYMHVSIHFYPCS